MMVMDMDKVTFSDGFRTFLHKFNGTGISDVVITTGVSNFPHIGWSTTSMTNSDTQVESFCNILKDSFLMQMNRLVARKVYNYRKSDFDGLRTTLSCTPWEACFSAYDVNSSVESF